MKKFSFKDFVALDTKQLLVINGGSDCSGSSSGGGSVSYSGGSSNGGSSYSSSYGSGYGSSSSSSGSSSGGGSCSSPSSSTKDSGKGKSGGSGSGNNGKNDSLHQVYTANYGGLGTGCGTCSSTKKDNAVSTPAKTSDKVGDTNGGGNDQSLNINGNGGSCSGVSKNSDYEEAFERITQENLRIAKEEQALTNVVKSIEENNDKKYICKGDADTDYRCDNWVQEVLADAGFKFTDYMAGDAKEFCVQNHIDNLVKGANTYTNKVPTEKGAYVVFMNDGHEYTKQDGTRGPMPPHTGILIVGENGYGSYFYDNSSGNSNGGVEKTVGRVGSNDSSADIMSQFGYDTFYYQKIEIKN